MPLLLPNVIKTDFRFLHVHSYRNTSLFLLFIIIIWHSSQMCDTGLQGRESSFLAICVVVARPHLTASSDL